MGANHPSQKQQLPTLPPIRMRCHGRLVNGSLRSRGHWLPFCADAAGGVDILNKQQSHPLPGTNSLCSLETPGPWAVGLPVMPFVINAVPNPLSNRVQILQSRKWTSCWTPFCTFLVCATSRAPHCHDDPMGCPHQSRLQEQGRRLVNGFNREVLKRTPHTVNNASVTHRNIKT